MKNLELSKAPVAKAEMLIRKPVAEDRGLLRSGSDQQFRFTRGRGRLDPVTGEWDGMSALDQVTVKRSSRASAFSSSVGPWQRQHHEGHLLRATTGHVVRSQQRLQCEDDEV